MKLILLISCLVFLSACSMHPTSLPIQVEVATNHFVTLPLPSELQQDINVSQLISAQWGEEKQQKLLVQLQVDKNQVVFAGFSAWGMKLLSLHYSGVEIKTDLMAGLADTLPKPEQVLFNLMIAIWPIKAWQTPLENIGWKLQEQVQQRRLFDNLGKVIVTIDYKKTPYLDGKITIHHQLLNYTVIIETN
jgi:hypothetical protein